MSNLRFKSLAITLTRQPVKADVPKEKISDYFGINTFNNISMLEFLTEEAYKKVKNSVEKGEKIDRDVSDQIASSLKSWAMGKGATHYTHWFQPLTGETAEKHDAFINPREHGITIEQLKGQQLIQQEPDASSFPHGGIRNTFEARGYTAWDPTSPAFIMDKTLCIPTIFVSYTGEALDYKTPLLKALDAVDRAATDICGYFDRNVTKVNATLGIEQEYFLVDSSLYDARPDLILTGRTVFGHASAKDQQLADHYFGIIPERVIEFMKDFEVEAHKLGIPLKTRHNEVAPNQFECAPLYEEANVAVDHNQLLMHLIKKVAKKHNFTVLLHEKPYAAVNGSGKHSNWSLMTNHGDNLFSPGKTPKTNLRFLAFLVNVLKAVYNYSDLIRSCVASASNDLRLGAHEAPPAIISVFIGTQLTNILDQIEKKGKLSSGKEEEMNLDIPKIPEILFDNTDRNRTSPFAFTGDKFEFRAVGSSANCSQAMTVLNTVVADQLKQFKSEVDSLISKGVHKNTAVLKVIKKYIAESKKIRFEGNSYSEEWIKEAGKRGLPNIKSTPQALKSLITAKALKLFEENKIFTKREIQARYEIRIEDYTKKIQIESRIIGDIATNHIIPIAIKYQNTLIENVMGLKNILNAKEADALSSNQIGTIKQISEYINGIKTNVEKMIDERKKANRIADSSEKAIYYNGKVLPFFEIIRNYVDKLELMVDNELWPLPKYRELLFVK